MAETFLNNLYESLPMRDPLLLAALLGTPFLLLALTAIRNRVRHALAMKKVEAAVVHVLEPLHPSSQVRRAREPGAEEPPEKPWYEMEPPSEYAAPPEPLVAQASSPSPEAIAEVTQARWPSQESVPQPSQDMGVEELLETLRGEGVRETLRGEGVGPEELLVQPQAEEPRAEERRTAGEARRDALVDEAPVDATPADRMVSPECSDLPRGTHGRHERRPGKHRRAKKRHVPAHLARG